MLLTFACGFKLVTIVLSFWSEELPLVLRVGRVKMTDAFIFFWEHLESFLSFSVGLCFILTFQYVWNSWLIVFLVNTWNVTSWSSRLQRSDKKSAVHLIEGHLYVRSHFFPVAFKIPTLSVSSLTSVWICLGVDLWVYPTWSLLSWVM